MNYLRRIFVLLLIGSSVVLQADDFNVSVTPNKKNWMYRVGENAVFTVSFTADVSDSYFLYYEVGLEKMAPLKKDSCMTSSKKLQIDAGTLNKPGFLRCTVTVTSGGNKYTSYATAAFQPEDIKPTVKYPKDFLSFWKKTISEAKKIPLDTRMDIIESRCTDSYNVYELSYLNSDYKKRFYGILTVPKGEGSFPAVIRFPGAGVHPMGGNFAFADKGFITLDIYIHPFPMTFNREFYDNLLNSPYGMYMFWGVNNRDLYFYKDVITGCAKAVDVIYELPKFDGKNLASIGSSQGGALSIITTSLDKRIRCLVALCPAMCDHVGYLHGRAGGWPHFFNEINCMQYNRDEVITTSAYYDVVNFAKHLTVPGFYSWGFNDPTTPPTSFYSAYNVITAPKSVHVIPNGVHEIYTEQIDMSINWISNFFNAR